MLDEEEALSLLKAVFNHSNDSKKLTYTGRGKSLSEALTFASTNPQYDERLFIELQIVLKVKTKTTKNINANGNSLL